jgi:uncharacterized damage-inducible protein DinB
MKIDSSLLKTQLDYTYWASDRILDAARPLSEEELARDLGNSFGGVLGTLIHIFEGDRMWLSRVAGSPRLTLADAGEKWMLDSLQNAWVNVHLGWIDWAGSLDDVEKILDYVNLAGNRMKLPVWQVVFHVVNHGTYHRGQITTMLRQLGASAVSSDLHNYYLSCQSS